GSVAVGVALARSFDVEADAFVRLAQNRLAELFRARTWIEHGAGTGGGIAFDAEGAQAAARRDEAGSAGAGAVPGTGFGCIGADTGGYCPECMRRPGQ